MYYNHYSLVVKAFVLKVIIAALHQMTKKAFPFHPQGRNFRDAITSKATCPNWPSSDVVQGLLAWKQGQMWYCKKKNHGPLDDLQLQFYQRIILQSGIGYGNQWNCKWNLNSGIEMLEECSYRSKPHLFSAITPGEC